MMRYIHNNHNATTNIQTRIKLDHYPVLSVRIQYKVHLIGVYCEKNDGKLHLMSLGIRSIASHMYRA